MSEYKTRITQLTVTTGGIYDDGATILEVDDHGGGEFVTVRQPDAVSNHLTFDDKNWPPVREAMDQLFKYIKGHENDTE